MRNWLWWYNPKNWLGETRHQELLRRIGALEENLANANQRINELNNVINLHMATPLSVINPHSDDPFQLFMMGAHIPEERIVEE